jgi:hypothetical protein
MALRFLVDLPKAGRIQAELSGEAKAEGPTSPMAAP